MNKKRYSDKQFRKILMEAFGIFSKHFGYTPHTPREFGFDPMEYKALLEKCVEDDFDYTIELCGTPAETLKRKNDPNETIWD